MSEQAVCEKHDFVVVYEAEYKQTHGGNVIGVGRCPVCELVKENEELKDSVAELERNAK